MTTRTSLAPARMGQARDEFLRSDPSRNLSADDLSRLRKFVTWCGISTSIEAVQPFKIEEFLAQQLNTSTPPRSYIPALKAFYAYAHQQGFLATNPMSVVRLPRGAGAAAKKSAPAPSAAAIAAQGARLEAAREAEIVYVSRARLEQMQADLERMRTEERHKISQLLHDAIKDGDLSENAAYDDAKMRQGMLEAQIRDLETKLRNAEVIEDQEGTRSGIGVGSHVRLQEVTSGDMIDYQVVGPEETNPRGGKISHRSPVGKAIMGKNPGDEVEVATPGGAVRYRVVTVD